jgi:hypothetical protein
MDAQQQPGFQAEASVPSQRSVFPPKRHPWWAWVILWAWVGILFALAMVFGSALRGETGGSTRCLGQADRLYTEGR